MRGIFKSVITKICICVFSLIFFLGLLEIGLRLAGYLYSSNRISSKKEATLLTQTKKNYSILCIGDSYTFGGEGNLKDSYPSQLQRMLDSKNYNRIYNVVNAGACELDSKHLLLRLPGFIQAYKPEVVILLVGAANRFNLGDSNLHEGIIKNIIRDLRIYKMARILHVNLKGRILAWQAKHGFELISRRSIPVSDNSENNFVINDHSKKLSRYDQAEYYFDGMADTDTFSENHSPGERAWFYCNTADAQKTLQFCEEALQANSESLEILYAMACIYRKMEEVEKAIEQFRKAINICNKKLWNTPDSESALSQITFFYHKLGEFCCQEHKFDLAVEILCKAIKLDPAEPYLYYLLTRAYTLQSEYSADYILRHLHEIEQTYSDVRESQMFRNYYEFFKNSEKWEKIIDGRLNSDLEEIVNLCQENGIKVIILNYPYPYSMANKALDSIRFKYSLSYVNNCSIFNKLLKKENQRTYFVDDAHCTTKGHQIVAKNVYDLLVSEGIVGR